MFTDEKGYARSIPLPYGTYVVRETTSKHNYAPVDDFYSEDHRESSGYTADMASASG